MNRQLAFIAMSIFFASLIAANQAYGQAKTEFPWRYDNYDNERKASYDNCIASTIDLARNHMHLEGTWAEAEHLAHTSCNNEFNQEDTETGKYENASPIDKVQNLLGGLFK
jgi:hypothetical protein